MIREPGDLPSKTKDPIVRRVSRARSTDFERDSNSPAATAAIDSPPTMPWPDVTVVVCASCRDETGSDAHPRAGELLGRRHATRRGRRHGIRVRQVECLGNCKRRLSAAILRDGCWSYVFGDLTIDSGPDLVAGAKLFATSTDGLHALARPPRFASSAGSSPASLPSTSLKDIS